MRYRRPYTLFKRTDVSGKPIWYFRIYINDKRVTKTTGCTSKERAMMYVDALLDNSSRLRNVFSSNVLAEGCVTSAYVPIQPASKLSVLFADYAEPWWLWDTCEYVKNKRDAGTEKKPGIKRSYVDTARLWTTRYLIPFLGSFELDKITSDTVNQFLSLLDSKYGLAPKTINNVRSVLSVMMAEAKRKKLISDNPVEGSVCRKTDKRKVKLLSDEECAKLFDTSRIKEIWDNNIYYYAFSYISGLTGMRAGELLALTIDDITPDRIFVSKGYSGKYGIGTTKTSEERTIPITKEMYQLLYVVYNSHKHNSKYIFTISGKKPMGEGNSRLALYRAMARIGISEEERKARNITFHAWRHKFTTDCVKANMHPLKIRALTGHKSSDMLYRYTDLDSDDLAEQTNQIQKDKSKMYVE